MPPKFCPECGAKAVAGAKFCPECGGKFSAPASSQPDPSSLAPPRPSSPDDSAEPAPDSVIARSDVQTRSAVKDSVVSRSTVRAGGPIEDSVVNRSDIRTQGAGIRDTVISHSTITQTETHQHFGESVGTYEAQMDLGRTAYEGKNWQEAVDFFNTALKIDKGGCEPWFLKGMACAELARADEAVTNLRRALKLSGPRRGAILDDVRALSERFARQGLVQEGSANELIARSRLELQQSINYQSQSRAGKESGLVKSLALDLLVIPGLGSSMRTNQAVEGLERRQEADKREAEGRRLEEQAKGFASEAVRLYNSAIRFCDLVIEFEKQDAPSWLRRGEILFRMRLYDDACKSFEAVLEFNPGHPDALRMRGMCYNAQGRPAPAPPGALQPPATPPGAASPDRPDGPSPPAGPPTGGRHTPMIPQPVPSPPQHGAPVQPRPVMVPPVQPGRAQQAAPAQPRSGSAPVQPGPYPGPTGPRPAAPARHVPPGYGGPQYGMPGPAPARPARANPCPYCRGEMRFVRERGIWQCVSCRQYSARPVR